MLNVRETLAKKRRLAVLLFVYTTLLLVGLSAFLRRYNVGNKLLLVWQTRSQDESSVLGYDTFPGNDSPLQMIQHHHLHRNGTITVAIGGGITSKGTQDLSETNLATSMSLFTVFIPSFCQTASPGFDYRFYFAYDQTDPLFSKPDFLLAFKTRFVEFLHQSCAWHLNVSIHTVQCSHSGKPTWAQNDAMLEAYLDNVEYYYRINDDTKMITKNWTEMFIEVLRSYVPLNVGVVGPKHRGGNTLILTYDFVHRTHVDVFGFYYPRLFTDWWGDDWITRVYGPLRTTKHQRVYLEHTMGKGRRYNVNNEVGKKLKQQVETDKKTLHRYIKYTETKDSVKIDDKKVIAMSLFGQEPRYIWGAIRNAQLAPIFFPGWKLRFYVTSPSSKAPEAESWLVPKRILNKLKQLGADVAYIKTKSIPPVFWRYLVVDDSGVDYFIVRNADSRLSERDAIVVNDWLQHQSSNESLNAFHCIRDHPNHASLSVVDGLWGGRRTAMRSTLNKNIVMLLIEYLKARNSSKRSSDFLRETIWPLFSSMAYCHDSVSGNKWPGVHTFLSDRLSTEYLGERFDEHQVAISTTDADSPPCSTFPFCTSPISQPLHAKSLPLEHR